MSLNVDLPFAIIVALLAIIGTALIVGGVIAYRDASRTGSRTLAAAAVAAGVVIWVIILYITPVFVVSG
jgi:hypothetical protein